MEAFASAHTHVINDETFQWHPESTKPHMKKKENNIRKTRYKQYKKIRKTPPTKMGYLIHT